MVTSRLVLSSYTLLSRSISDQGFHFQSRALYIVPGYVDPTIRSVVRFSEIGKIFSNILQIQLLFLFGQLFIYRVGINIIECDSGQSILRPISQEDFQAPGLLYYLPKAAHEPERRKCDHSMAGLGSA